MVEQRTCFIFGWFLPLFLPTLSPKIAQSTQTLNINNSISKKDNNNFFFRPIILLQRANFSWFSSQIYPLKIRTLRKMYFQRNICWKIAPKYHHPPPPSLDLRCHWNGIANIGHNTYIISQVQAPPISTRPAFVPIEKRRVSTLFSQAF